MEATFEYIKLNEELGQSAYFGRLYKELFETPQGSAFTSPLIENISELLNNILLKYDGLTQFQKDILKNIFNEFNKIRIIIDPQRLKSFKHYFNEDEELLLYRDTEFGLTNIIINPDECIAYSYIPKGDNNRKLYFIDENGEFEKLAYDFFSN